MITVKTKYTKPTRLVYSDCSYFQKSIAVCTSNIEDDMILTKGSHVYLHNINDPLQKLGELYVITDILKEHINDLYVYTLKKQDKTTE